MKDEHEILDVLNRHLQSIVENDLDAYHQTTSEDLSLYEWFETPNRIDGLPFHDFYMSEDARRAKRQAAETFKGVFETRARYDLANLRVQHYGHTAIACYTLLSTTSDEQGVHVTAHNESRVLVQFADGWKVVHVHKSPAWPAPHVQP